MKCVTNTLLLCLCIVVTSQAQIGIHVTSTGDVGIGDDTPYSRLTLSGPIGLNNGNFPALYIYESGFEHAPRSIFVHSPQYPDRGLSYDPLSHSFRFGTSDSGVTLKIASPSIGIGIEDPENTLVVAGNSTSHPAILRLGNKGEFDQVNSGAIIFDEDLDATLYQDNFCGIALRYNGLSNQLEYLGDCTDETDLDNAQLIMALGRNGNVGVGVQPDSAYRLQVAGDLRATEIVVESGWADYVFSPSYSLRSLSDVERFIKEHHHLPGIPSAAEVQQNGLEMAEISKLMMEKIEELTLYTIEQDKAIEAQKEAIELLMAETNRLRDELATVKNH